MLKNKEQIQQFIISMFVFWGNNFAKNEKEIFVKGNWIFTQYVFALLYYDYVRKWLNYNRGVVKMHKFEQPKSTFKRLKHQGTKIFLHGSTSL